MVIIYGSYAHVFHEHITSSIRYPDSLHLWISLYLYHMLSIYIYVHIPINIPISYEYINNISPARFEKITDFLHAGGSLGSPEQLGAAAPHGSGRRCVASGREKHNISPY